MRRSSLTVAGVFLATVAICGGVTFSFLQVRGVNPQTLGLSLRLTAWVGLLMYLVIFVSRPLQQLGSTPLARSLVSNRRYIGVAFAAVMIVHLVLLLFVNGFVPNLPGGGAYLFILLMLLTSFDRAVTAIGPRRWRLLHTIGLYWIGVIFAATIVGALLEQPDSPIHLTLVSLFLAAIALRVSAFVKVRQRSTSQDTRRSMQ